YHQPPPAASNTVAAMAPIHRPFLLPPAPSSAESVSFVSSKLVPKLGASLSVDPSNTAAGAWVVVWLSKSYDSPATWASWATGTSATVGTAAVGGAVAAAFRASGSSQEGIFTSSS